MNASVSGLGFNVKDLVLELEYILGLELGFRIWVRVRIRF